MCGTDELGQYKTPDIWRVSFNIDTTYTHYTSNNWKLSLEFAELLQYELQCLREELWSCRTVLIFYPPDLNQNEVGYRSSNKMVWYINAASR